MSLICKHWNWNLYWNWKYYIFPTIKPRTTKTERRVTEGRGRHPPSHVTFWWHCHVTNVKPYICTSAIPMATKPGRVVTYYRKTIPTKTRERVITWSRDKCKTLYLHFRSTYGQQTWQSSNLPWGDATLLIMQSRDRWRKHIYTSTISMATKLGRVVTCADW